MLPLEHCEITNLVSMQSKMIKKIFLLSCFLTTNFIQIYSMNLNGLSIESRDGNPVQLEAFMEKGKPILRINGVQYKSSLKGTYFMQDNKLYDASTGYRVGDYTPLLKNFAITGCIMLTVGAIIYTLHKKGILKQVYPFIKKHSYAAVTLTASLAGIAGIAAYTLKR